MLTTLSHDDAEWAPAGVAAAGVRARTEADVQHVVRTCAELSVPVVARGAGTGLSGGANAVAGCVVLDLSRMDKVLEIDPDNLLCVVQPGAVNNDVKAAVAEHGLWYPPDPASAAWSTIGGNVATNAGGLCCLKYGVTRDYVLGLRAVVGGPVAYGDAVRLGRRTTKGVAGLDLVGLFVGSEGTLGIVTEVTLRLRPAPTGTPRTVVAAFAGLIACGEAVAQITRRGLTPAVLELLDRVCLEAVEDWKHLGIDADAAALLLARVDTAGDAGAAEAAAIAATMADAGATWVEQSTDDAEAEALFEARRLAYPALERLGPVLTEDICVPRSAVPVMLAEIAAIAARHGVPDRDDRARRRRQLASAADHAAGRRSRAGSGPGGVRGVPRRGHRPRRHGDGRARGRHPQARRHAQGARPWVARAPDGDPRRARPAGAVQSRQGLTERAHTVCRAAAGPSVQTLPGPKRWRSVERFHYTAGDSRRPRSRAS